MKRNSALGLCCFFCFLACQASVHAMGHPNPELPVLVQEAKTICVGRVTQIEDLGPTQVNTGLRDSNNQPAPTLARNAVADVAVQTVLKGKISPKSIQVAFYKNVHQGFNPAFFTELTAGETDILFLEATDDGTHFSLSEPNSAGKSKIVLGDAKIGPTPADMSPLRNVLSVLANALADKSNVARLNCLQQIGSVGFTLNLKPGDPNYTPVIQLMKSLNEPGASELKSFINSRILPPVLKLMTDPNADVREQAVYAAGRLQEPTVLPTLAEMADKQYEPDVMGNAASIIGEYKAPEAVKPLTRLLESKNHHVRHEAVESLRSIADPLAVPSLLEHLDDPDLDAQYYIVTALFTATDTPLCPGPAIFQAKQDDYVSFWKKWASEHQDKVALLREQFLSPLPTRAAPAQAAPKAH